jgi:serine/threonine protein kinase
VHRDLKPENLFLARDASGAVTIKVLDFGIAKSLRQSGRQLTLAGHGIGSPRYMAPEQIDTPDDIDHRADIWALGVVGYEMLAGMSPFEGRTVSDICAKVVRAAPVPLTSIRPDLWPELAGFVSRCLRRDPKERFQTAMEARVALESMRSSKPAVATTVTDEPVDIADRPRARWPKVAVVLALASLVSYMTWIRPENAIAYGQHTFFELPAMDPPALAYRDAPPAPSIVKLLNIPRRDAQDED